MRTWLRHRRKRSKTRNGAQRMDSTVKSFEGLELLHEARGNAVVAIKDNVFEEGGNTEPARSCGGLQSLHAGSGGDHNVAAAHRPAYENNFDFNFGACR